MNAIEILEAIKRLPQMERENLFSNLAEEEEWQQNLHDLLTIERRRYEPSRPADDVFRDLGIDE
jgi:hypothetical protein